MSTSKTNTCKECGKSYSTACQQCQASKSNRNKR